MPSSQEMDQVNSAAPGAHMRRIKEDIKFWSVPRGCTWRRNIVANGYPGSPGKWPLKWYVYFYYY